MVYHKNQQEKFKKSLLALCVMAAAVPTFAQDSTVQEDDVEEVVVTGMRQALGSAQDIKRNAATVVESITSKDLGAFPDKSVAEALQRVAGITVNRFAASDDTAHFSAEPSGVVVRGLNQVRTEFNGRDSFSANSSRGLGWGDVSPELMSGVDTYKNQMAELIEGGIAGTVNMRTRVPFDSEGQVIALTASANYGDLSKEVTPEVSGLYSNRWETGVGEWGIMGNFAHSEVTTQSQNNQLYRMNRFEDVYGTTSVGSDGAVNNSPINADSYVYIPAAVRYLDNVYERERNGVSLAAQWKDNDDQFVATLQVNRTEYDNAWEEYIVGVYPADLSYGRSVFYSIKPDLDNGNWRVPPSAPQPAPGYPAFAFDQNGLFQSGHMTADIGWWGQRKDNNGSWTDPANLDATGYAANAAGQPMVSPCYGWNGCAPNRRGLDMTTTTRSNNNENVTQDIGFNLKWTPTDNFRANFDFQFVDSEVSNYDIETNFNTWANVYLNMNNGNRPITELTAPTNVNMSPGLWSNPNNYYIRSIMDHVEDSEGEEFAARADFEFDVDSGWIQSVKAGIRFADRDQIVRWSGYNWQNVSNTWTGTNAPYFNLDRHSPSGNFNGYPEGYYETRKFKGDFFNLYGADEFVFADMDLLQNQRKFASQMSASALGLSGGIGWDPICSNTGDRAAEEAGTCYTPAEVVDVSEETNAIYVQLNFGGDDLTIGDMPVTGNIGVRYVETEVVSNGGIVMPRLGQEYFFELIPDPNNPGEEIRSPLPMIPANLGCQLDTSPIAVVPGSLGCFLSEEDAAFMNGANFDSAATNEFDNLLPSLNVKIDLNDEWLVRIAASQAISRPDIGNLRSYLGVGSTMPSTQNASDSLWIKNSSGQITGANVKYSASAQNPFLKPVKATQYDLSLEYYFADVGSFTTTLFYKEFDDYIQFGSYNREITNQGVTREVEVRGPLNGEGAEIQGYEIAFQRYMDFLPSPYDGFGIQANYTYIDNKGITNSNVRNTGGQGTTLTGQAPDQIRVGKLEGLSEDSYNLVLMYEKGDLATRLAYSWRSEYLQTAIDCCVAYPIWTDSTGMLDGSISYKLTDNLTIKFAANNLLNEQTRLNQQVAHAGENDTGTPAEGDNLRPYGLKLPNSYMQADRRYTLSLSFQY